jgi:hypothetical protein
VISTAAAPSKLTNQYIYSSHVNRSLQERKEQLKCKVRTQKISCSKTRSCLMANMAQRSASKLFDLDPIDQPDKYDEVLRL